MFEFMAVTSADMAEDMSDTEIGPTERGDQVLVIEMSEVRVLLHLRRGMGRKDVVKGLRVLADSIEDA